ncbi:hypothetical protein AYO44_07220 [Planctomycetaceae bacterium SCGC AG-212-F19]|nr:hypothetical protein AYO44_07220 [Planctomycetaceae bacterium SCGC AG-212-F19]
MRRAPLLVLLLLAGCSRMPADYARFQPEKGQFVMEVDFIEPDQEREVRKAVEAVPGVKSGSVMTNLGARYVAFTLANPDDLNQGPIDRHVEEKLQEFNIKVIKSKTRLPTPPP